MFSGGAAWPELKWVVTDSLPAPTDDASQTTGRFPMPDATDVAFLQYTSGEVTVNKPKERKVFRKCWRYVN